MSTIDADANGAVTVDTNGAPEAVLPLCDTIADVVGGTQPFTVADRARLTEVVDRHAAQGLRMLAVAHRRLDGEAVVHPTRADA